MIILHIAHTYNTLPVDPSLLELHHTFRSPPFLGHGFGHDDPRSGDEEQSDQAQGKAWNEFPEPRHQDHPGVLALMNVRARKWTPPCFIHRGMSLPLRAMPSSSPSQIPWWQWSSAWTSKMISWQRNGHLRCVVLLTMVYIRRVQSH